MKNDNKKTITEAITFFIKFVGCYFYLLKTFMGRVCKVLIIVNSCHPTPFLWEFVYADRILY